MSLEVIYSDESSQDVLNQSRWYRTQGGEDLANQYAAAVEATVERLSQYPMMGPLCRFPARGLSGLRSLPLNRPYQRHVLFYFLIHGKLAVYRVLDGARDLRERLLEPPEREDA